MRKELVFGGFVKLSGVGVGLHRARIRPFEAGVGLFGVDASSIFVSCSRRLHAVFLASSYRASDVFKHVVFQASSGRVSGVFTPMRFPAFCDEERSFILSLEGEGFSVKPSFLGEKWRTSKGGDKDDTHRDSCVSLDVIQGLQDGPDGGHPREETRTDTRSTLLGSVAFMAYCMNLCACLGTFKQHYLTAE
ncbi:hypothetical protein Tco_1106079 [Tanacetum coccineum]